MTLSRGNISLLEHKVVCCARSVDSCAAKLMSRNRESSVCFSCGHPCIPFCLKLLLVDTLLVLVLFCKARLVDGSLCCRDLVTQERRQGIRITKQVMLCVTRSHPSWGHAGVPYFSGVVSRLVRVIFARGPC